MRIPLLILVFSLCGLFVSATSPTASDWLLAAVSCTAASLLLLLAVWWSRRKAARDWIIVDGSNVMHWKKGTPQVATVREVISNLTNAGYAPCVVFDANAGYKLVGRYIHHNEAGRLLGLPKRRVKIAPKGTPADPIILAAARDFNGQVVTNDRFLDWAEDYPEVHQP